MFTELRSWPARRWVAALVGAGLTALVIGLPTDVIPNPVFGRPVDVTWWSYPVLVVTAVLGGLLLATYVRVDEPGVLPDAQAVVADRSGRAGGVGGLLSFFAVGCPVCNKLVVVALGTVGARRWFEPIQPYLAVASVVLLALAVRARLRNARSCRLPASGGPSTEGGAAPAPAHPVAVSSSDRSGRLRLTRTGTPPAPPIVTGTRRPPSE